MARWSQPRCDASPSDRANAHAKGAKRRQRVLTRSAYMLGLTLYERSQRNPVVNTVLIPQAVAWWF